MSNTRQALISLLIDGLFHIENAIEVILLIPSSTENRSKNAGLCGTSFINQCLIQ